MMRKDHAMDLSPDDILQILQGYQRTAILCTGIELGIFEHLAGGAAEAAAIAAATHADERGTRILLEALAAMGLLEVKGKTYHLTPVADAFLVRSRPAYLGDIARILVNDRFWEGFRRLPEAVQKGGAVFPDHAETPGHPFWENFARYSAATAGPAAEGLAGILAPWAEARRPLEVLDVACGTGLYGFTLAQRQPHARVWSLDWPNVLAITQTYAQRLGVLDRVQFIEGDAFDAPLGGPYDLAILSHIFHHFSEERSTELLRHIAGALKPDGRVAIHDFVYGEEPPTENPFPRLFSVLMLIWTREGESYPLSVYQRMLAATGFTSPVVHELAHIPSRILIADRAPHLRPS